MGDYKNAPLVKGFLEGYNTMDAVARSSLLLKEFIKSGTNKGIIFFALLIIFPDSKSAPLAKKCSKGNFCNI